MTQVRLGRPVANAVSPPSRFARRLVLLAASCASLGFAATQSLRAQSLPGPTLADPFYLVDSRPRMTVLNPPASGNFSGVTYNPNTDTLFVVDNGVSHIYEYNLSGTFRRTITTTGFDDAEGIVWMGGDRFGLLEEKNAHISLVTISPTTSALTKSALPLADIIRPDLVPNDPSLGSLNPTGDNVGLEGIAYDELLDRFYLVKEKSTGTPGDYGVNVFAVERNGAASVLFNPSVAHGASTTPLTSLAIDISDAHFDPVSRNLLLLSHESRRVIEVKLTGEVVGTRTLPGTQLEGVTISPDHKQMFIVGESREFFRYETSPMLTALVPPGTTWRFHDTGVDQGTAWRERDFVVDATWKQGAAELGYGDADERTAVRCGPSATCTTLNEPTKYFRHEFDVDHPNHVLELMLGIQRDDGAAVYLNGVEVYRDASLAPGALYSAFANRQAALSDPEEDFFVHVNISPALLRSGKNVLAVEVHQFSATDLDMSFNAQLIARYEPIPEPTSLLLAAAGAIGAACLRRYRRQPK
jgi:uncharacterized protein YjiK